MLTAWQFLCNTSNKNMRYLLLVFIPTVGIVHHQAMAWESSLVTHCLVKIPLRGIWHLMYTRASEFLALFSEDLALATGFWIENSSVPATGRTTLFLCLDWTKHWVCGQAGIFTPVLVQARFDSAVGLSSILGFGFPHHHL